MVTKSEAEILKRNDAQSETLLAQLYGTSLDEVKLTPQTNSRVEKGQEAAQKHRDKLLEYDRTRSV